MPKTLNRPTINIDAHPRDQFRKIEYNDIREFMDFRCELQDQRIVPLQKKINAYIQNVANVKFCFFICSQYAVSERYIEILGTQKICPIFIIQETNPFYELIENCKTPRILGTYEIDPNLKNILNDFLQTNYLSVYENCALIPIIHPQTGTVAFHIGIANFPEDPYNCRRTIGIVREVFNYTIGLISNTFVYEEERKHHELTKQALKVCFKLLEEAAILENLNRELRKQLCEFFQTERCYILISDNNKLITKVELSGVYFDFRYEDVYDLTAPFGEGIQGKVALTEKLITYAEIDEDPDPDFINNNLHRLAGLTPRNILCFPMFYRGDFFGVIELQNKIPTPVFTKLDEEYSVPFGIVCGYILGKCLTIRRLENTRFAQFNGDTLLLRNIISKKCDIPKIILCDNVHGIDYDNFEFIPYQIPEQHVICYCIKMLKESNFLDKYNIPFRTIAWFLCSVRNGYSDLPFHNWYHAFAVFHYLYVMITKFELIEKNVLTKLEAFAILIAALCHDLEFKGSTSRYQPVRGAVIASLYSSPGAVEKHFSANQTIRLFSIPETNILEEMGATDFKNFVILMNTLIISTDLWDHLTKMSELSALMESGDYDNTDEDYKIYLYSVIMMAGDLCSYGKSWGYCKFVSDRQYKEFYRFRDLYYAVNVYNLKNVSPNPKKFPQLQVQFITDICIPTFDYLQKMIPDCSVLYKKLEKNLAKFQSQTEGVGLDKETSVEDLLQKQISAELIPEPLKVGLPNEEKANEEKANEEI